MASFPQITSPPQLSAEVIVNEALETLEHQAVYGKDHANSSGLDFGIYGGRWGGFSVSPTVFTLTNSTTNYIVVAKASGVPTASTSATNWNDTTTNYARVYKLTTSGGVVTALEDHRAGPGGVHGGGAGGSGAGATGLEFTASSTTTDSDPGTGVVRWNNATQASATSLFIDNADADSTSLAALWASLLTGTFLKITDASDADVWQLWKVNAAPINGTGYYKFPVTLQAQEGGDIANASDVLLDVDSSGAAAFTGGTLTSALNEAPAVTIASAGTVNIGAAAANTIAISGTTTITAFDSIADGARRALVFGGVLTLTHNGTSLILPTGANITTAAGDIAEMLSLGSGNWRCLWYQRKGGVPVGTVAASKLLGRGSAAGSGETQEITLGTGLTMSGTTLNGAVSYGRHAVPIVAGAMRQSATGGCAPLASTASGANQPDITTLDFDATTQEYAQFSVPMPKSWDEGTVTFVPIWSHPATSTNFGVVWDLQGVAISDNEAIAVAYGTAQTSTDTGGTTNRLYIGPESSAITIAGTPAAEDVVFFRISRVTGNGSDTMSVDARLHGIVLFITTDASTDA